MHVPAANLVLTGAGKVEMGTSQGKFEGGSGWEEGLTTRAVRGKI